ncbi:MAG: 2-amino-4-hydroxy-6-hydroxymethyldihydropteridine diphosphokinase [Candidatus Aminicenantes bacterium]|jgi:2-amino-4-hydroxy-6-hydroxymethyldihydropteridine diphosphokinase|nr:2-amino-4-hydroxy-6-hydroxymethyldihydropteridine diphosphokinase [Candidatus Aminicenantes bacterium]
MRYFLSLGSNLGDRKKNLEKAAGLLSKVEIHIITSSSLYKTEPVGIITRRWFYNQALEVETVYDPEELLFRVKRIEERMGRVRTDCPRSRLIDIDIILAENKTVSTKTLQIPHPRMVKRNFVLYPLSEIAPEVKHPVLNETIKDLLERSTDQATVVRL